MAYESPTSSTTVARPHSSQGLKKIPPYWYPYTTMAKARWLGREILEVVSTEFRDRSMEYYRYALESGVTTINGKVAKPETIIENGDRIENIVHRHEPPVTSAPVKIILHDKEREFIVIDKPGSIPVHASGRYFRNSLVEILKNDFKFEKVYTVNRLDRLTSGLMIIPLCAARANELSREFAAGTVRKEYIARCRGRFPEEEVTCEEPLLTIDRQMGLNIVHPEGKAGRLSCIHYPIFIFICQPAKTIFKRLQYDANTDTSVLRCRPLTGRSHQIRVHLQYLGHPIANDPIYSETRIWGEKLGQGGVDLTPSDERVAPVAPPEFSFEGADNPESLARPEDAHIETPEPTIAEGSPGIAGEEPVANRPKLLPRETGHDIGMGSPVPLSAETVGVITRLRNMKDEDEDWSRWRDVVFRAKGALSPYRVQIPLPPQNRRRRGGRAALSSRGSPGPNDQSPKEEGIDMPATQSVEEAPAPAQLTTEEALAKVALFQAASPSPSHGSLQPSAYPSATPSPDPTPPPVATSAAPEDGSPLYCPECYLPLHRDPKPERLYIFLHALRYTTSLGCFETDMPEWASEGWEWDM
ncbi:Uncharacterized protein C18B11.02c [Grifola frondosa]|uniref:Uncharacterized protein C18B11.02c n=1 Tax=Grifola frondosa TaxID=5627 RepID=A0A1C7LZK6_GRIFR|nr:Uncharacterized protein C18B11.02c [Grifola frondosa]